MNLLRLLALAACGRSVASTDGGSKVLVMTGLAEDCEPFVKDKEPYTEILNSTVEFIDMTLQLDTPHEAQGTSMDGGLVVEVSQLQRRCNPLTLPRRHRHYSGNTWGLLLRMMCFMEWGSTGDAKTEKPVYTAPHRRQFQPISAAHRRRSDPDTVHLVPFHSTPRRRYRV